MSQLDVSHASSNLSLKAQVQNNKYASTCLTKFDAVQQSKMTASGIKITFEAIIAM